MRVLDARVDWKDGYANDPRLEVLVDEIPTLEELKFECHQQRLWYAELDGYARYFAWKGPENEGGYSGRHFDITTVDGESVTLKGPWSSRAGAVNKAGLGPVVDVSITTDARAFAKGRPFRSAALTLRAAKQAIDLTTWGTHLQRELKYDNEEPVWVPVPDELSVAEAMHGEPQEAE